MHPATLVLTDEIIRLNVKHNVVYASQQTFADLSGYCRETSNRKLHNDLNIFFNVMNRGVKNTCITSLKKLIYNPYFIEKSSEYLRSFSHLLFVMITRLNIQGNTYKDIEDKINKTDGIFSMLLKTLLNNSKKDPISNIISYLNNKSPNSILSIKMYEDIAHDLGLNKLGQIKLMGFSKEDLEESYSRYSMIDPKTIKDPLGLMFYYCGEINASYDGRVVTRLIRHFNLSIDGRCYIREPKRGNSKFNNNSNAVVTDKEKLITRGNAPRNEPASKDLRNCLTSLFNTCFKPTVI